MLLYPNYLSIINNKSKRRKLREELRKQKNMARTAANVQRATNPAIRVWDFMQEMSLAQARRKLEMGQHIFCNRTIYSHHGIYDGAGWVYEYGGDSGDFNGVVSRVPLAHFAKGDGILLLEYRASFSPERIVERAESRLGESDYNVLFNNCEHFAYWCRQGDESVSSLIDALEMECAVGGIMRGSIPDLGGIAGPIHTPGGFLINSLISGLHDDDECDDDEDDDDDNSGPGGKLLNLVNPFKRFPF